MFGETVKIKHTEVTGTVTAESHTDTGDTSLQIRYTDRNGLVVNQWYDKDDLTHVE